MQRMRLKDWALVSVLSLAVAACSQQLPTSPTDGVKTVSASANDVLPTVCSGAATLIDGNPAVVPLTTQYPTQWATPIAGSSWVLAALSDGVNSTDFITHTYSASFTVPTGATAISISGSSFADNQVTQILLDGAGSSFGSNASLDDAANYSTTPLSYGGTVPTDGAHTLVFTVENNNHTQPTNPTGLDFCFTVSYTPFVAPPPPPPPPPSGPVFVIGDVEAHALTNNVNFWGAQWWKHNQMSGVVSNGVAAFKGFADVADDFCGGTWTSLPGNSSKPPATLGPDVTIIVTSTVLKNGPNISGNIVQILTVHQDGGYGPNPGHAGNGPVTAITCPVEP